MFMQPADDFDAESSGRNQGSQCSVGYRLNAFLQQREDRSLDFLSVAQLIT